MAKSTSASERRTSVDDIFDHLYEEIANLRLRPGDKISEADVARQFGVSRQPVRDAFNRLANIDFLLIRPQRATEVKRFSKREIRKSRFVRQAVEREVLRLAAERCASRDADRLGGELDRQADAVQRRDPEAFGKLDYSFHRLLAEIAGVDFAADVILTEKSKVDRLCRLELTKNDRMPVLVEDHRAIVSAVQNNDTRAAIDAGMFHLSRLEETILLILETNASYFEP